MTETESINPLALDNQLCFALYVCSKEIVRRYTPVLEPLGLTYTAYITLMALWEEDNISVKNLGKKLYLDSGTMTPLLKKMEKQDLIKRVRSSEDERSVFIILTKKGHDLRDKCSGIPKKQLCLSDLSEASAKKLLVELHEVMKNLENK